MKRRNYILTIGLLALSVTFTSCIKNEYYTPEPTNNGNNNGNNNNDNNVFNEEFDNDARGWAFSSSTDSSYASVKNGKLEFVNYSVVGTNTQVVQTNGRFTGSFSIQSRIKSDNDMGIVFGNTGNNYDYGYSFILNNGGFFVVYKEGNANTAAQTIKDWTANTAIRTNDWNDVTIEQKNNYWTFYVNGYEVYQMQARPLGGTYCGFILLPQTVGYADYLTVSW